MVGDLMQIVDRDRSSKQDMGTSRAVRSSSRFLFKGRRWLLILGPWRLHSARFFAGKYSLLYYGFLIGAILPFIPWLLHKRYPRWNLDKVRDLFGFGVIYSLSLLRVFFWWLLM